MKKRNTPGKSKVWELLKSSKYALCHHNIEEKLGEQLDRVTIYRILQGFYEEGLVHRIMDTEGKSYFACCKNCSCDYHTDNHLHFRCKNCNKIQCMDIKLSPQLPEGYLSEETSFMVQGYCPECNNDTSSEAQ